MVPAAVSPQCSGPASGKILLVSMSPIEVRVLGSLVEKERTTPESYPLSTNALVLACNQKSNRDPVVEFHRQDVEETIRTLAAKGLVRSVMSDGERVVKHQHLLAETLGLNRHDLAVLAVLMLRGAQTPGELRSRTERYVSFSSLAHVEESLNRLAGHQPSLARNLGRGPGQSQDRWIDTFNPDPDRLRPRVRSSSRHDNDSAETDLRAEVARLQTELDWLYSHLGLQKPDAD